VGTIGAHRHAMSPDKDSSSESKPTGPRASSWPLALVRRSADPSDSRLAPAKLRAFAADATLAATSLPQIVKEQFAVLARAHDLSHPGSSGSLHAPRLKLLLDSRGPGIRARIYGASRDDQAVCYVLLLSERHYFAACDDLVVGDLTLHLDQTSSSGPLYVFGLIADEVDKVDLNVGGQLFPGLAGRNAYVIKGPPVSGSIPAMSVHLSYRSGKIKRIPVH
jgi:hypothetical protein